MTIPYAAFPTCATWETDSTVSGFGYSTWRMSDAVLEVIDELVKQYNDPNRQDVRIETLFHLQAATQFWLTKLNKVSANRGEPQDNITGAGLPTAKKVDGHVVRTAAMTALRSIACYLLVQQMGAGDIADALERLEQLYSSKSSGGNASSPGSDALEIVRMGTVGRVTVFLDKAYLQRRYKLRFCNGVAWRWNQTTQCNTIFDTTDNVESEMGGQKTHFVMDTRGRIYAGFNKQVWFKHSSFIGGANAYSAGRIKIVNGKIVHIENHSGHYAPALQQMRNVLHRLRLYGCRVDDIVVQRHSHGLFTGAQILVTRTTWPDGGGD